jgi:nucleotide-binding universal stress UspA family protein
MAEMTEEIIVGYDGSPGSELALRWGAREASDRGITLTVCHAWAPEDLALIIDPPLLDVTRRQGEEIVERGVQHAEPFAGPGGVQPLVAAGSAARVLCEHSGPSTLVAVGSRGHGRLAGLLLGSVAWQLAGHAQGRIVIVREPVRRAYDGPGPVVAGVDGSPEADTALLFAAEEAALRHVPVLAVCALADTPGHLGGARQAEEEFSRLLTCWEKEHPGVTVLRQVSQGSPRTALLEAGAQAQMIIVGSRGRGGVPSMTLGSVASALLHYAPCPVGIVRPAAAAQG